MTYSIRQTVYPDDWDGPLEEHYDTCDICGEIATHETDIPYTYLCDYCYKNEYLADYYDNWDDELEERVSD